MAETNEFDFIVIGSGAGGGPLACRLAEAGYRVCVLEAGGDEVDANYHVPVLHAKASEDPAMRWDFFVRHYGDTKLQERDSKYTPGQDGVLYPRCSTLGGCTAHNAMIMVYPHNSDWDYIQRLTGDVSWSATTMRKHFEKLERCEYASPTGKPLAHRPWLRAIQRFLYRLLPSSNPGRHGFDGWATTNTADPTIALPDTGLLHVVKSAAKEALERGGLPDRAELKSLLDPNDWRVVSDRGERAGEGVRMVPLFTSGGRRRGTREFLRETAAALPDRLIIRTRCLVTRILFDGSKRATGVEYVEGARLYRADRTIPPGEPTEPLPERRELRCRREVIVCGGAFNTPQILKLSGVGPAAELARFGIPVVADRPGVGENLQDRYEVGVVYQLKKDFALLAGATFTAPAPGQQGDPYYRQWEKGRGVYTTNGAVVGVIARSSPDQPDPDLFIFGLPSEFRGYAPGYSDGLGHFSNRFTWAVLKAHTDNRAGSVTLRSRDPRVPPLVNFRYFEEGSDTQQDDLKAVVSGVKFAREIMERVQGEVAAELVPGPAADDDAKIADFVRREAWGHHASCTCPIGTPDDPRAVLDSEFRVMGVSGVRVVDASVFPRIPGFFIVSAIYMVSEKAAEVIIAEHRARPDRGAPAGQTGASRDA